MNICKSVCICSLSNAKIRRSTDSVDLLNANYVNVMNPTCVQFSYLIHIILIWVTTIHSYATSMWWVNHFASTEIENAHTSICSMRVFSSRSSALCVCICIHEQPPTTTCIHLQPSNITCLKHMFTPDSFYLKVEDSIDRIQSNDGSEYR